MPIRKAIIYLIKTFLLPSSRFLIFDITEAFLIKLRLTDIVKKSADRKAFLIVFSFFKVLFPHGMINAHTVLYQSSKTGTMEFTAGGRCKKNLSFAATPETKRSLLC